MSAQDEMPKVLTSELDRQIARRTREFQWKFTERAGQHNPLWFCVWNKHRLPEKPDEFRCCLMSGLDITDWIRSHPNWFRWGQWSEKRQARSVRLTDYGRQALMEREKYDMELVHGGLVTPGYVVEPAPSETN